MAANVAFCLSGSGCDIVQGSRYGSLLGVPTALWGVLLDAAIGALAALGLTAARWTWAFYLVAAGVGFSIYLTAVSVLVIHATCADCLASDVITVAILLVLLRRHAVLPRRRKLSALVPGALAAAVLAPLGAAFIYAAPTGGGSGFEGALARHLREQGAVMYGAYPCRPTAPISRLSWDAARDVPYVDARRTG